MMMSVVPPPDRPAVMPADLAARLAAEESADISHRKAAGMYGPPGDLWDPDDADGPALLAEEDLYDDLPPMSRVDALEWELWAAADQDEAERAMLRREAPEWVFLPPGGELASALEPVRPQYLSPVALIELMKAASRLSAWAESIKTAATASFYRQRKAQHADLPQSRQIDSSGRPVDPERSWAAEIAAALHLSKDTAARHIDTALHLTGPLSATHTALKTGALTWSKALSISEATRSLSDDAAQAVESHVLRRAASQTHANLRKSLRTQVAKHSARAEADRHREAASERTCKIVPLAEGMAGLWVVHTADKIQQMWVVVQAMADLAKRPNSAHTALAAAATPATATPTVTSTARPTSTPAATSTAGPTSAAAAGSVGAAASAPTRLRPGPAAATASAGSVDGEPWTAEHGARTASGEQESDEPSTKPRTAEQRRADVMADLFEQLLRNGIDWLGRRLPDQHRRRPHIEVLIPANTLLGLDDEPCELSGYGPIPAEMARRIAADGTWRRLLTDPMNGAVLEASTTRHDPGALVSETLLARHPTCAWPGCNRSARECDRDHGTPFAQSGRTSLAGLAPYCKYHHVIKDTPDWGWTTTNHPDGSITLTAPTGHRYTTVPPARGPISHRRQSTPRPPAQEASAVDPPPF